PQKDNRVQISQYRKIYIKHMATMENDKATLSESAHQIRPLSLTPLQNALSISTESFHRSAEERS
ncbi:hypothetical protein Q8G81_34905, partial [Klebsiella pneumoniae]